MASSLTKKTERAVTMFYFILALWAGLNDFMAGKLKEQ